MDRKPQIEKALASKIDEILKESGKKYQSGNKEASLNLALEAWDLIPEPKGRWDYYPQSLSSGFVQDYVDLADMASAKKWIEITAQMYDDPNHEDHYVLMIEGEAMYKLGDTERAYYVFGRIHELYGRGGFEGEQLEYLEFYLKERAKRGG